MSSNRWGTPSEWFLAQCAQHSVPDHEVSQLWDEYSDFKLDGYSWDFIKVRLGFADPSYGEEDEE